MSSSILVCPQRNPVATGVVVSILRAHPDFEVAICSGCLRKIGCGDRSSYDVVVIPTGRPGREDIDHIGEALRHHPQAEVLVLSLYEAPHYVQRLAEVGCCEFLPLDDAVTELPRRIRELAAGHPAPRCEVPWRFRLFRQIADSSRRSFPLRSGGGPVRYRTG